MAGPPWWGQGVPVPPPTSHKDHTGWRDRGDRGPAMGRVEGQGGTVGNMGQGKGTRIGREGEGGREVGRWRRRRMKVLETKGRMEGEMGRDGQMHGRMHGWMDR